MRNKLFIIAVSVTSLLVIIYMLLPAALSGPVRLRLEREMASVTGLSAEIETFSADFSGEAFIGSLSLENETGETVISAGSINIRYSLLRILSRKPIITSVTVRELRAYAEALPGRRLASGPDSEKITSAIAASDMAFMLDMFTLYFPDSVEMPFRAEGSGGRVIAGNESLDLNCFRATWSAGPTGVIIDSFSIESGILTVTGNGAFLPEPVQVTGSLEFIADAEPLIRFINQASGSEIPGISGLFSGKMKLSGTGKDRKLRAEAGFDAVSAFGTDITSGKMDLLLSGESSLSGSVSLLLEDGRIGITGAADLSAGILDSVTLEVSNLSLALLSPLTGISGSAPDGVISGKFLVSGPPGEPHLLNVSGESVITGARIKGGSIPDTSIKLVFSGGRGEFTLLQGENEVSAAGGYADGRIDAAFRAEISKAEDILSLFGVTDAGGSISAGGTVTGTPGGIAVESAFYGGSAEYRGITAQILGGSLLYDGSGLSLDSIRLSGGAGSIKDIAWLLEISHLEGSPVFEITLDGAAASPSAELTVQLYNPVFLGEELDEIYLEGLFSGDRLETKKLQVLKTPYLLNLDSGYYSPKHTEMEAAAGIYKLRGEPGELPLTPGKGDRMISSIDLEVKSFGGDYRIKAREKNLDIREASALFGGTEGIAGTAEYQFSFRGTAEKPEIDLDIEIRTPEYGGYRADLLKGGFRFSRGRAEFTGVRLSGPGGNALLDMSFNILSDGEGSLLICRESGISGNLSASGIDLSALDMIPPGSHSFSGTSELDLKWSGSVDKPVITGFVHVNDGAIRLLGNETEVDNIELRAYIKDSQAMIRALRFRIAEQPVTARGSFNYTGRGNNKWEVEGETPDKGRFRFRGMQKDGALSLHSDISTLDLGLVSRAVPGLNLRSGVLNSVFTLTLDKSSPVITGFAEIGQLEFPADGFRRGFHGGSARARFEDGLITLEQFRIRLDDGRIIGSGKVKYDRARLYDPELRIAAEDIRFRKPGYFSGLLKQGRIRYFPVGGYYLAQGDIILESLQLTAPFNLLEILMRSPDRPAAAYPEFIEKTQFDLDLTSGRNIWMDNNLGRLRIDTDLTLTGTIADPILSGRVSVEEGYVLYLDRKFRILRGTADFSDITGINPDLDIAAETQIRSYRQKSDQPYDISLSVSGRASRPEIDISSDPYLTPEDIVALLTFGATREQLTQSDASGESDSAWDILTARAGEFSSSRIYGYLSAKAGSMLNLDYISIEGDIFQAGTPHGPRITAEKNLTENTALAYIGSLHPDDSLLRARRQAGPAEITYTTGIRGSQQRLRLGVALTPNVTLESSTEQDGRSSIGLKYRLMMK